MTRYAWVAAALLALAPMLVSAKDKKPDEDSGCGSHGTAVSFEDTPSDAAKKALKEKKLVFVLHVSGLFEDPKLT